VQPRRAAGLSALSTREKESFIDLGLGRRVHAVEAGDGPALVYFPGNGCSAADMDPVAEVLARRYRFVGIDPPGREPTEWPDEPFSFFDDLPRVYDRCLAELGVGQHVAMGHSMGGMYALHHACRHRGEVRGLVLFEGFVTLAVHRATVAPDGMRSVRMRPDVEAAFLRRRKANLEWERSRPAFRASFWASQQAHDARLWVGELDMPVLVFVGHNGQPLPATHEAWRRQLGMERVADLTVEVIPRAGHWMMLDDPEAVSSALLRFLDRLDRDASAGGARP